MNERDYAMMKMPITEIGRALACSSDNEQATLLNELGKQLTLVCRDQDLTGMQICYFAQSLDKWGRLLVKQLSEHVELIEADEDV